MLKFSEPGDHVDTPLIEHATIADALSEHGQFGLQRVEAEAQVRQVVAVVAGWKSHFAAAGVRTADVDSLAQQLDRPFLEDQRRAWGGAR